MSTVRNVRSFVTSHLLLPHFLVCASHLDAGLAVNGSLALEQGGSSEVTNAC